MTALVVLSAARWWDSGPVHPAGWCEVLASLDDDIGCPGAGALYGEALERLPSGDPTTRGARIGLAVWTATQRARAGLGSEWDALVELLGRWDPVALAFDPVAPADGGGGR